MKAFNFTLLFDDDFQNNIKILANKINKKLDNEFSLGLASVPHATILKFEYDYSIELLEKFNKSFKKPLTVNLAGITLLPSKNGGVWVEISILKTKELIDIQSEALSIIHGAKILNKTGDLYRPHITLSKIKDNNLLDILNLDYQVLRKKQVLAYPTLGYANKDFEFFKASQG